MKQILVCIVLLAAISCKEKVKAPEAFGPTPSKAQLEWHRMELNAFIHFTTNTFTGLEWGTGAESATVFAPTSIDVDQWIRVLKEAGFKGAILTCKHHDGFCLWPSKYTKHSIRNSPYENGEGDLVKDVSEACKKYGLKFGVYLSPWDRNHKDYGGQAYLEYYRNQLREIFTNYGPVFEMWFDGANGGTGYYGGANEKRSIDGATYYDWPTTLNMVREMEPEIIFFSDAGPGVRWVGNERGIAGETNWNRITPDTLFAGKGGIESLLGTGHESGTHWIPAEVDVSIRKGWFYHAEEDSLVKSPDRLLEIYMTSVGRGSTLLLNVPPDKRGLIHENDVASLLGFRKKLDSIFKEDKALKAKVTATNVRGGVQEYNGDKVIDNNDSTFWCTGDDERSGMIEFEFDQPQELKYILLMEHIPLGQRVKEFKVESFENGSWKSVAKATTIGYKRILQLDTRSEKLRVTIVDSNAAPLISRISLY
jgi:alpha-L-fucosidase